MTNKEAIAVLENEIKCVTRRANGECSGGDDCATCDLVLSDSVIRSAFRKAIKELEVPALKEKAAKLRAEKGLPPMDRLTRRVNDVSVIFVPISPTGGEIVKCDDSYAVRGAAAERLAEYEDTGLTPDEVAELAKNARARCANE
ncbi:MAG: hypothetical protein NC299_09075 [Lachnospiraceae bacterium]|nr:hypothetical protein [Lachnospiraceae bacterium]